MKKVITVIAIIAVIAIGAWLVTSLFSGDGNATFVSYAPGGNNVAYVTPDDVPGIHPAYADPAKYVNGDRIKVKLGNDGYYKVTGGPY